MTCQSLRLITRLCLQSLAARRQTRPNLRLPLPLFGVWVRDFSLYFADNIHKPHLFAVGDHFSPRFLPLGPTIPLDSADFPLLAKVAP